MAVIATAFTTFARKAPNDTVLTVTRHFMVNTDTFTKDGYVKRWIPGIDLDLDTVHSIKVIARASIEGPETRNERLARERAARMKDFMNRILHIEESKVTTSSVGEDWPLFIRLVEEDAAVPARDEVLAISRSTRSAEAKEAELRKLNRGETWKYLMENQLPAMRFATLVVHVNKYIPVPEPEPEPVVIPEPEPVVEEVAVVEEIPEPQPEPEPQPVAVEDDWYRKMYIKTNAPAWALLWQNIGVEVDLAKHWSVSLPLYWSPYNYGKQTLKFRTLAFVPEVRYWPCADNMGFFVNAHFGVASYNYAKDGEYRYQDHDGRSPAIGGGVGVGYRFYFCRNHHWSIEVGAGAGVYRLDYDIFLNTGSTKDGYLLGRRQRTFFGVDQAFVTFSYSFGLRKKGGNE